MQQWFGFYSVIGGAAVTLLGLLFVAVSINAAAVLGEAHGNSRRLAEQAFQNYLAVMLVSLLAIFPTLAIAELGLATLAVTALWSVWVLIRLYLALTRPYARGARLQSLRRQFSSLVGFGMLIVAALRMAFSWGDSRNLFAAATIVLLSSATAVSWELLLGIAKDSASGAA
ncbi:MAG: hypothetical protein WDN03_18535 [Rhizomicrobium sp.]